MKVAQGLENMGERKKGLGWFRYILLIGYLFLPARNFEPMKTINEMYSAPWYFVIFAFFISVAVGMTLGLHKGKLIRRETISERKEASRKTD